MYAIYCDTKINMYVNLKRIGIKIRPLSIKEKEQIIQKYNILSSNKNNIYKFARLRKQRNLVANKIYDLVDDELTIDILNLIRFERYNIVIHKNIKEVLNKVAIVQTNDIVLNKYIRLRDSHIFVKKFINLYKLYEQGVTSKNNNFDIPIKYKKIYRQSEKEPDIDNLSNELILKYVFDGLKSETYGCFYVKKSFQDYINYVSIFINKLSDLDIFKFIQLMEMYFLNNYISYSNNILTNVIIIESLIVKSNSNNISKEFVLKSGIIAIESGIKYSNKDLKYILNYIYRIRSILIHGNINEVFTEYNTLIQNVQKIEALNNKNLPKMSKYKNILYFTDKLSYEFLTIVFKYWISNTDKLNFIKNN